MARGQRRAVLYLLKNRAVDGASARFVDVASQARACAECGNLDHDDKCSICRDPQRDHQLCCVVEDVGDLWAMERAAVYQGAYHILGGTLSALDGRGPDDLQIDKLVRRANALVTTEVILALWLQLTDHSTLRAEKLAAPRLR